MKIEIKYFGLLAEAIGKQQEVLVLDKTASLQDLKKVLLATYPLLKSKQFKVAINQCLIDEDCTLSEQDEVALLPPFAGG